MACGSFRRRRSSCASSFSRWPLCLLFAPLAGADEPPEVRTLDGSGNNRSHPDWGKTNTQYIRVAKTNYADGVARPVRARRERYVSNRVFNDSIRTCSRRTASPSGASSGDSSWTTRSACVRRREARTRRSPSVRPTGSRASPTTLGLDPVPAHPRRTGYRHGQDGAGADQHRLELHRRLQRLRRDEPAARVAARGPGRREALQQRGELLLDRGYLPRAGRTRRRRLRARDGADGPAEAPEAPRRRSSPATCGRTRTSRSRPRTRCSRWSTTGSSRASRAPARGGEVPDRPPHRRGRAAVHHLQRVPPRARGQAAAVPGLQGRTSTPASGTSSRSSATALTA